MIPGPALLTANDLALAYGHQRLLESVTLSVAPGEKVGLVGRNGCGKTSLLRILAGHQEADAGDVARRRGLRIGYLPQEFELNAKLTVRENIDAESILWLEEFLHDFPGAVIFVTHDRYFLDVIATRIIELADGRCYSHPGNYTAYLESKAIRQQIAEQSERRRQRFLREELEWVRAGVRAQRSKPRHRLESFYNVKGLEAPPEEREMDLLIPPPPELGNTAMDLVKVGASVGEGERERWLFRGLTVSLKPAPCTGIVGRHGAGKTTL